MSSALISERIGGHGLLFGCRGSAAIHESARTTWSRQPAHARRVRPVVGEGTRTPAAPLAPMRCGSRCLYPMTTQRPQSRSCTPPAPVLRRRRMQATPVPENVSPGRSECRAILRSKRRLRIQRARHRRVRRNAHECRPTAPARDRADLNGDGVANAADLPLFVTRLMN